MIVAGHQPNYLPWLGFFDKIRRCDVFIVEDNVQFERQGFTNRNRIKIVGGSIWLTVPVEHTGSNMKICEVRISPAERGWAKRHWLSLQRYYSGSPFWTKFSGFFEQAYSQNWELLMDLNLHLIRGVMSMLSIEKPFVMASSLGVGGKKSEAVLAKCKALHADTLLSGLGGKDYLDLGRFEEEGIRVLFQDFKYPTYPQLHGAFVSSLSVIDYLFCTGGKPWWDRKEV